MFEKKYEVIVVGGGINGLGFAALSAHDGKQVAVFERSHRPGGRAQIMDRDGFILEGGMHTIRFGRKSALAENCQKIGKPLEFVDPGYAILNEPGGIKSCLPYRASDYFTHSQYPFVVSFEDTSGFINFLISERERFAGASIEQALDAAGAGPDLRRYIRFSASAISVCPFLERASAGEYTWLLMDLFEKQISLEHIKGGWGSIYSRYEETLKETGNSIFTDTGVERVVIKGGRATGIFACGQFVEADLVVVSVPVQDLFKGARPLLDPDGFDPAFVEKCLNQRPTAGVNIQYGLKKPVEEEHAIQFWPDPIAYGGFLSVIDDSLAPAGKQHLTVFAPSNIEDVLDPKSSEKIAARLDAEILASYPEIEKLVEWKMVSNFRMVNGAEVNIHQLPHTRPGPAVPGVENLVLVGDSTGARGAGGTIGHNSVHAAYAYVYGRNP